MTDKVIMVQQNPFPGFPDPGYLWWSRVSLSLEKFEHSNDGNQPSRYRLVQNYRPSFLVINTLHFKPCAKTLHVQQHIHKTNTQYICTRWSSFEWGLATKIIGHCSLRKRKKSWHLPFITCEFPGDQPPLHFYRQQQASIGDGALRPA